MKLNYIAITGLIAVAALAASTVAVADTVTVTPSTSTWFFSNDGFPNAAQTFVVGPGTPPTGTGSVEWTVDSTGTATFGTLAYSGTQFANITTLQYSSYNVTAIAPATVSLSFDVDFDLTDNNNSYQGRLEFKPSFTGTVLNGQWQTWDANAGRWWASDSAASGGLCGSGAPCTRAEVLANWPHIGLRAGAGSLLLKLDGPISGGATAAADRLVINGTTYDFEQDPTPPTSACGGFTDVATNSIYCNQVEWLKNRGVTLGCTATEYCPDANVTRAQMALFMQRLGTTLTPTTFTYAGLIGGGGLDLDAQNFICLSAPINSGTYPQSAYVNAQVSGRTTAAADYAINVNYNTTGDGANFPVAIAPVDSLTGSPGASFSHVTAAGHVDLAANTVYQFAVRVSRAGGSGDLASGSTCTLNVEMRSRTGTSSPYDH